MALAVVFFVQGHTLKDLFLRIFFTNEILKKTAFEIQHNHFLRNPKQKKEGNQISLYFSRQVKNS